MSKSVYKQLAFEGLKWSYLQQFFVLSINYGTLLILANLIEPKIHGAVVLASLPTGLTGVLGTMGIREKILKETSISDEKFKELIGLIIVMSLVVTFLTLIVSIIVALLYAKQFSFELLIKLGFSLAMITPLSVFNNYFEALQSRQLKFKKQNILSIVGIAVGCLVAILAAYADFSYAALIIKLVVPNLIIFLGYVIFIKVDFKFTLKLSIIRELKNFITYFSLNSIFNYLVRNVDYLIIGKFFSGDVLGQYSIAYKILLFPMRTITSKVNAVLLPILARIDPTTNNFKQKYFLVITVLSFLIFPLMGFISLTSHLWVPILFNSNYILLPRMVSILAVVGMLQALVSPVGTLFLLKENLKFMLRNSIIVFLVVTVSYLVSSIFLDIYGVVTSFALIWIFLLMPITLIAAFKPYKYHLFDFIRSILPALISLAIVGLIAYSIISYSYLEMIPKIIFSFLSLSGGYLLVYHLLTRKSKINLNYLINLARG